MKSPYRGLAAAFILLAGIAFSASADTGFSAGLNFDFLNYEKAFIAPEFAYMPTLAQGMELSLGIGFGIYVQNLVPTFQIPVKAGLNFIFPEMAGFEIYVSTGLLPEFIYGETQSLLFFIGPYLGGGVRFKVHPLMSWFINVEQPLLIGAPKWLNTGTRVATGMQFRFATAK